MARALYLVLVLAATAYAEPYAFNQVEEVVSRVKVCLAPVEEMSFGYFQPATDCTLKGKWKLQDDGETKEFLVDFIPNCLEEDYDIDSALLAATQLCLAQSLAKDLEPAQEGGNYNDDELFEINDRVVACLSSSPETANIAEDCSDEALYQAMCGYPKEALVQYAILPCFNTNNVPAQAAASAQECIAAALAKPLTT